jgi:hypothetical protein
MGASLLQPVQLSNEPTKQPAHKGYNRALIFILNKAGI